MSRSQFLAYFLLGSLLTTRGRADRVVVHTIKDNDLRQDCVFELNNYGYNLCPLVERKEIVERDSVGKSYDVEKGEGPSTGLRIYEVALGGLDESSYSTRVSSRLEGSGCDMDTWICMLGELGCCAGKFPAILGAQLLIETCGDGRIASQDNVDIRRSAPIASSIARKARSTRMTRLLRSTVSLNISGNDNESYNRPLKLSLYGGTVGKQKQSAEVSFVCCDKEKLKYVREEKGVHFFSWATSHGCPVRLAGQTHSNIAAANEPGSEGEESAPEEKQGDDDLMPLDNSRARRWIAIIMVVLVSGLLFGTVLLSSSRARSLATENLKSATYAVLPLLSHLYIKLLPIGNSVFQATKAIAHAGSRFRQGDSKLVRWAQEDMSLMDSEDFMVNGSGAMGEDDWNINGMEEYIPLTVSPQHGRRSVRSYGATPDVETFSERGAFSGFAKYFHR
ncbi:hypothetical protein JR316_0011611 [Psilocybe cubensis]|uniref:Uncharacterized protein n=2 Tax=Psilocybe cubensis TaxID=181762 RepID=A0ACB8GKX9_PSICU|nr:hypothetical protein JR316_0011611 [Psilocybe cubensis]KAH9476042.1 hypothetical protein JR316_0011611 [Psilocybe cubensis]